MLAGTQTLFESREDFFARNRLYATSVYIVDAATNLVFPFLTEVEPVQASSDGFEQISAFTRRELEGCLEDLVGFSHGRECSRRRC